MQSTIGMLHYSRGPSTPEMGVEIPKCYNLNVAGELMNTQIFESLET